MTELVLSLTSTSHSPYACYASTTAVYSSAYDVALKLRPDVDDLRELGPEFSTRWKFFESNPDKSITLLAPSAGYRTLA